MQQNEKNVGIVWEAKKPLAVLYKSVQEDLQRLMDAEKAALKKIVAHEAVQLQISFGKVAVYTG